MLGWELKNILPKRTSFVVCVNCNLPVFTVSCPLGLGRMRQGRITSCPAYQKSVYINRLYFDQVAFFSRRFTIEDRARLAEAVRLNRRADLVSLRTGMISIGASIPASE